MYTNTSTQRKSEAGQCFLRCASCNRGRLIGSSGAKVRLAFVKTPTRQVVGKGARSLQDSLLWRDLRGEQSDLTDRQKGIQHAGSVVHEVINPYIVLLVIDILLMLILVSAGRRWLIPVLPCMFLPTACLRNHTNLAGGTRGWADLLRFWSLVPGGWA